MKTPFEQRLQVQSEVREAGRMPDAFASIGASGFDVTFLDIDGPETRLWQD